MPLRLEFRKNNKIAHDAVVAFLVDTLIQGGYPANFVCIFPKNFKNHSNFNKIFGEKSTEVALRLMNEALENPLYRDDAEIKAEIEERIKFLTAKPLAKTKCKQ